MWLLISVLLMPLQEAPKEDPAAGIEWSKPEDAEIFKTAHDAYLAEDFKEAMKLFKKASRKAKGKPSRRKVAVWVRTSEGALALAGLKKMASRKKKRIDALRQAEGSVDRYQGTIIHASFKDFIIEMRTELYFTLEDFEKGSGPYKKKRGKRFVKKEKEAEFVKEGKYSIEWKVTTSPAELKVKKIPKDLTKFHSVSFWIYFPKGKNFPYQVVFMGKGKSDVDDGGGQRTRNGYSRRMKGHEGWKKVVVPLKKFQPYGSISWSKIKDFRITIEGRKGLTVYVDDIHLIRK